MTLPFEAAVAQLVRQGFARDVAEREVQRQLLGGLPKGRVPSQAALREAIMRVPLPFSIVLPWSVLISDNDRLVPIPVDATKARLILTDRYKTARQTIVALIRQKLGGGHNEPSELAPVAEPVQLLARVFVPDNRIHDVPDFAKGVHDAMARQVFTNDAWIYRAVWERAGVDVDRPRAEITISPFEP